MLKPYYFVLIPIPLLLATLICLAATESDTPLWLSEPPPPELTRPGAADRYPAHVQKGVEAVVINPFQMADVGCEVAGIIEAIYFEEGDRAREGEVVVRIKRERYEIAVMKASEKVKGLEQSVAFAEQEAANKEELYRLDATTAQEVLRLKTQLESGKSALAEARLQLMLARQDLEACDVKAPFSGYLAARYKQPNEPVHALDRLFSLVDSARVYAVAHVPEDLLSAYRIGTKCLFVRRGGEEHSGQVERIGKILDPKTKAKKVHVLIDNSDGLLEIGMTGFLGLAREE